jgi:hypothetical protein
MPSIRKTALGFLPLWQAHCSTISRRRFKTTRLYSIWGSHSGCCEELCLLGYNAVYILNVSRRYGETCRLHLQGRRMRHSRNQRESSWHAELCCCSFLFGLFFDPEDGGDMFFRNVGWISTDYKALYPTRMKYTFIIPIRLHKMNKVCLSSI